jgi:hypothetical protein
VGVFAVARLTQALGGAGCVWSERGLSEVVVLVRGKVWVTAVLSAKCGQGNGRPWSRPTTGASDATAAAVLGLKRRWLFSRSCPGSGLFCGGAADPGVGRRRFCIANLYPFRYNINNVHSPPL